MSPVVGERVDSEYVDVNIITVCFCFSLLVVNESVPKADEVVISGVSGDVLSAFSWYVVSVVSACLREDIVNIVFVFDGYIVVLMSAVVDEKVDIDDVDVLTGLFVYS